MDGYWIQICHELQEMLSNVYLFLNNWITGGGVNFDAKIRRNSTIMERYFLATYWKYGWFAREVDRSGYLDKSDYLARRKNRIIQVFDSEKVKLFRAVTFIRRS